MSSGSESEIDYHFSYCELMGYINKKINIKLIKNYKNYNLKSRKGIRYKTVIKQSTKNINILMGYRKTIEAELKKYGYDFCGYDSDLKEIDRYLEIEKFKLSIHYMKNKLPDELIYKIFRYY